MDKRAVLKNMLHNIINDDTDKAALDLHSYLTAKMREVSGLGQASAPVAPAQPDDDNI